MPKIKDVKNVSTYKWTTANIITNADTSNIYTTSDIYFIPRVVPHNLVQPNREEVLSLNSRGIRIIDNTKKKENE